MSTPSDRDDATSAPPPDHRPRRRTGRVAVLVVVIAAAGLLATAWLLDRGVSTEAELQPDAGSETLRDLADASGETPAANEPAPDFSVRTFDGSDFTLSHHLEEDGRPVILNLWASWCIPCRNEMPLLDDFAAEHPEVAVVGVAVRDDPEAAGDFAEELGVTYTLGYDEKEEVDTAYRALGLPATFWISPDGVIAERKFGEVDEETLIANLALFD